MDFRNNRSENVTKEVVKSSDISSLVSNFHRMFRYHNESNGHNDDRLSLVFQTIHNDVLEETAAHFKNKRLICS